MLNVNLDCFNTDVMITHGHSFLSNLISCTLNIRNTQFQKHLGNCMAEFQIELMSHWSNDVFTVLSESNSAMEINEPDSEDDNDVIEDVNEN